MAYLRKDALYGYGLSAFSGDMALKEGADNLIDGCLGDVDGKSVLLICEDPALGWYDAAAPAMVAKRLGDKGAKVRILPVSMPENEPIAAVQDAMNDADEAIFFSRIGDQGRFKSQYGGAAATMSYALNARMLGGYYGRMDHHAMKLMKDAIDEVTFDAHHIHVTCPNGTDFEGSPAGSKANGSDVVVNRFPMGVPQPILSGGFEGKVRLCNYLTPTGSKLYTPEFLKLDDAVTAQIDGNRITGFDGPGEVVAKVEAHYQHVAGLFGLDAYSIDSWHAGIHPLMEYDELACENPTRWSETVFPSPRFLHFHTCGEGPPGEICWMVLDPTISIDGVALWENGRLYPERFARTKSVLDAAPALAAAYAAPSGGVGLG